MSNHTTEPQRGADGAGMRDLVDAVLHHAEPGWCPACGAAVETLGDHHSSCPLAAFLEAETTDLYIGQRIREARCEQGWSQSQLGTLLVPPRTYAAVSDMERGKTAITVDTLITVARATGKPVTWFLPREDAR